MRIREIEAENFKLFTKNFHEVNEIEKSDLIVFNGPNGYGKTSAFDIIEFCLTGTIKRSCTRRMRQLRRFRQGLTELQQHRQIYFHMVNTNWNKPKHRKVI